MPEPNSRNTAKGKSFQLLAARVLSNYFKVQIKTDKATLIGDPPKKHVFDLASTNGKYFGESKNYAWTETDKVPSAKLAFLNEAVLFLHQLPSGIVRFVVMRRDYSPYRHRTLAGHYYRTYKHLLDGVAILEIDVTTESVESYGLIE